MRAVSNKDLQNTELQILKSIDKFCRANNIRYSLYYGTLLGAIRHKGFIPWDDDVDIVMPREDYKRFIRTYDDDMYILKSQDNDFEWPFPFAKCMDMRLLVDEHINGYGPFGAYVDVFPIDGLPEDSEQINNIYKIIYNRWNVLSVGLWPSRKAGEVNPIKVIGRFTVTNFCALFRRRIVRKMTKDAQKYNYDLSKYVGVQCLGTYHVKNCLEREKLGELCNVSFEDGMFYAFQGYDYFLKSIYGNYMEMPPVDKRIVHKHDLRWNDN